MIISLFTVSGSTFPDEGSAALALKVAEAGRVGKVLLHFSDGLPDNHALLDWLRTLCRYVVVSVRGNITNPDQVESLLRAGITSVVVEESMPLEALSRLPRERAIVAMNPDLYPPYEQLEEQAPKYITDRMNSLAPWVSGFIIEPRWTDKQASSMPIQTIRKLRAAAGNILWAKHPILTMENVPIFDALGIDAVIESPDIQMCGDAFVRSMHFADQAVPTVAVDKYGQVLRVAWSSAATLTETIISGGVSYCGRDGTRDDVLTGLGRLLRVLPDDQRSSLMFVVAPFEPAGTTFSYSAFGSGGREFGLHRLFEIIQGLKDRPRPGSYTSFLFEREDRIPRKLNEEVRELLEAGTRDEIAWEAADVLFFLFAYLAGTDVPLEDVVAELMGRKQ